TAAWVDAWDELAPDFNDAIDRLVRDADGTIPAHVVARDKRVTQALQRANDRLDDLAGITNAVTTGNLFDVMFDASTTRYDSLLAQLPHGPAQRLLNRLNEDALDAMVARTTQRIHSLTIPLTADTVAAMRTELVRGI